MSDETVTTELSQLPIEALVETTKPNLYCRDAGYDCAFHTKSPSGLKRHITRTHKQRKRNNPRVTSVPAKQTLARPKFDLKVAWFDYNKGQALQTDQDGNWWVAKKLDI